MSRTADTPRVADLAALNITQAAQLMAVSTSTIRRLMRDGHLPAIKVRGTTRIRRTDIDDYLNDARDWEPSN